MISWSQSHSKMCDARSAIGKEEACLRFLANCFTDGRVRTKRD